MTNDMFTPPERRPAPAHLRARILDEIEEESRRETEPERSTGARRWIAPLVAASLLAASGAGGVWYANRPGRPEPLAPWPTPSAASATPSATPTPLDEQAQAALKERCSQQAVAQYFSKPAAVIASPSGRTVLVAVKPTADQPTKRLVVCTGGATGDIQVTGGTAKAGPDGAVVATAEQDGQSLVSAGGAAPTGFDTALLAGRSDEIPVSSGWWVTDRSFPTSEKGAQPEAVLLMFSNKKDDKHVEHVIAWPGTPQAPGSVDDSTLSRCPIISGRIADVRTTVMTPSGSGVLVELSDGKLVACGVSSDGGGIAGDQLHAHGVVAEGGTALGQTNTSVIGGRLPAGVTGVMIRTPRGVRTAVVKDVLWAVDDIVPPSQEAFEPRHLWVEMTGAKPRSFWLEWNQQLPTSGWGAAQMDAHGMYATSLRGFLDGWALSRACQVPVGVTPLHSMGGHVLFVEAGGRETICSASAGSAHRFDPAATPAKDAATFALHEVKTDRGPVLLLGGGRLPAGVTGITFVSPDGQVPATIKGGRWVHEQLMVNPTPEQTPVKVRLTGPGLDRMITLR